MSDTIAEKRRCKERKVTNSVSDLVQQSKCEAIEKHETCDEASGRQKEDANENGNDFDNDKPIDKRMSRLFSVFVFSSHSRFFGAVDPLFGSTFCSPLSGSNPRYLAITIIEKAANTSEPTMANKTAINGVKVTSSVSGNEQDKKERERERKE
jgi:hypothetical protein